LLGLAVALLAAAASPNQIRQTAAIEPPPPVWTEINHPLPLFDLTAPELAKSPMAYQARRHILGGGRQDILTYGGLNGPTYLRLQLYRLGTEPVPATPLYVDLARAAAQADVSISHSLPPTALATRFGTFEVADISLAGRNAAGVPCLGFRGAALGGGFRISGFACGGPALLMSRPTLACLIDRLDLNAAGDDQALASFFAATELKRNPACAGGELRPIGNHASWLDRNDAPPQLEGKKLL
jgi:hypothetical protein